MTDQPERLSVLKDVESPPGGWRMTVPDTGHTVKAHYAAQARQKALDHMVANSVPVPPDFDEWADDLLCRESGHGHPWCGVKPPAPVQGMDKFLTLGKAKRFLMTVIHAVKGGRFVSAEEALQRAAVCAECPLAGDIGGCKSGCSAIFKTISRAIGENPVAEFLRGKKNDRGEEISFCLAWGCWVQAKTWLPNDVLDAAEGSDRPAYHEKCWRLNSGG